MKHILALAMIFSVGCVKVAGNLKVDQHVVYNKNGRTKVLLAGDYKAKATLQKDHVSLKLKGNFEKHRLTLAIPTGTVMPTQNGNISVSAADLKQPFGLEGAVKTDITRSETVSTTERCSVMIGSVDCNLGGYYDGRGGYHGPYSYCHGRRLDGTRDVRYHNRTTVRTVKLQMVQESEAKATFEGADVDVKKVYEFTGVCSL